MDNPSFRPERTRSMYSTMELCHNRRASPHGSIELIISAADRQEPVYYFWPLDEDHRLSESQWLDICVVVERELSGTVLTRLKTQRELFNEV